jgi:hypothetical protein
MTTLTDMLDTIVGSAFAAAQKTAAIRDALLYHGLSDGDSNEKDMATALLAANILNNQRMIQAARTDNSLLSQVKSFDQLITPEIERLLTESSLHQAHSKVLANKLYRD